MTWLFSIPIFPVKNTSAHTDLNQRYSTYVPAVLLLPGSFCRKHERSLQYTHISHTYSPQIESLYFMTQNKETEKNIKWPLNTFFFLYEICKLTILFLQQTVHWSWIDTSWGRHIFRSWTHLFPGRMSRQRSRPMKSVILILSGSNISFHVFSSALLFSELFAIGAIFLYALRRTNVYFPADNRRRQLSGHKLRS